MRVLLTGLLGLLAVATAVPAEARRTAIDMTVDADGNDIQLIYDLGGYCDLDGSDCDGTALGYDVDVGGGFTSRVFIHGNGILTFGEAADFTLPDVQQAFANFNDPALADYQRNLLSSGQNNQLDFLSFEPVFLQSASISVLSSGQINARWFTCFVPLAGGGCPESNLRTLTLTPFSGGYNGSFGGNAGGDRGYVINGVYTPTENNFVLAARFRGLTPGAVPEPSTWAMMIGGFGLVGGMARRRSARQTATA